MQELSFYLTGLLIVSSFLAISVTLAPKLLDSLVKETNFNTINEKKSNYIVHIIQFFPQKIKPTD